MQVGTATPDAGAKTHDWLLADLDCDRYSPRKTNRPCTCWCKINDPAIDERATVVDRHNNRAAIMFVCYSYFRSERQRPMCRGQSAGVQSLTTRSLAAAFDGIDRCYSRLALKEGAGQNAVITTATA